MTEDQRLDQRRRRFLKTVGAAAATATLAGCGGGGGQGEETTTTTESETTEATTTTEATETTETEQTETEADALDIVITQGQDASTLDVHNYQSAPTNNVLRQAYELLLMRTPAGEIVERLATDWEQIEPDRHRLWIREGVQFHSGDELTPEDVVYSIRRIVDNEVGFASPQKGNHPGVVDAEPVDGERAVDIVSSQPNPAVFDRITAFMEIGQKSFFENNDQSELATSINGTGPYQLEEYVEGEFVEFSTFDNYWGDEPPVDGVTFRGASESSTRVNQLLSGETDLIVNTPVQSVSQVQNNDGTEIVAGESNRVIYVAMRNDTEPFTSQQFRQAMNLAVDVESIIENQLLTFGSPISQPTPEGIFGHNPDVEPYEYDPERAAELVEESGMAGAEFTIDTPVGRYLKDLEVAQTVAGYIDDLPNVSCSAEQRDFATLLEEIQANDPETSPSAYLLGLGNIAFLGSATISLSLLSDAPFTSFSNEDVDQMFSEATSIIDRGEREAAMQELNAELHDLAPWIFLHRQFSVYGKSTETGFSFQPRRDERIHVFEFDAE